jgi:hypothetical protein
MTISSEAEYQAAMELFRIHRFDPERSKHHPLQRSMEVLAAAVDNYKYISKDVRKAA